MASGKKARDVGVCGAPPFENREGWGNRGVELYKGGPTRLSYINAYCFKAYRVTTNVRIAAQRTLFAVATIQKY